MTETREEVKRRQRHLLELFESTDACLNKLSDKDHALLELRVKNLKNRMAYHKQSLERTEYVVLVAGERNSKKSTLLSLILGEQLLPDSFLGTSSIICELRYGITHKIVAHFTDADPETGLHTKTIQLGQMAENSQQIFLQQISSFFLDQDRQGCNKVEIFWPNNLLKETIVIVDSPAFDELYIVDEKVKPYLSKAFAVICVINSLAQQHMIEEPIKKCRKVCLDQRRETSSIFPLFLCNDWDQLSQREADSIKNHVIGKLREYWPELDPDSQIIYFSSLNALNDEKAPKEFALLMDGIKSSALLNIKATLQKQWRWLNFVISCMAYHMKMVKDLLVSDDLRLDKRLRDVEKRLHSVEKEMQGYFRKMADDAARVLSKHLQTREVVEKFTSWTLDDIPKTESSWEVNEHFIQDAFMKRLQNTIAAWEDENHILSNTHISLVHFSNQRLNKEKSLLPLQYLENFVITDDAASESNICPSSNDFGAAKKVLIGVTSPIWVPVSLVVVPIFGVMTLKEKFKKRKDSTKYVKDQQGFIVKASREFLRHASKEQQLSSIVKEQLKDAQDHLTRASSRLRELTAAYKMLYHQLRDETRPKGKIKKSYGDLEEMSVRVKEKLALFFIKEVQYMVISRNDLEWDRGDQTSHLGKGAFASVYRGTFRIPRQREPAQVAVKLWNEELNESTAVGFLSKTEALRAADIGPDEREGEKGTQNIRGGKNAFSVMRETREEVERRQRHLLELFESTDACLNNLSDKDHALLELGVKNLTNQMAYHKQSLERTEYVVLVAGERDSKKSRLLSLIIGEQLLPDSFLGTSSFICELRYGTTHKLVAHFKDADPETGLHSKTIQLEQMAENSQKIFLLQISFFLNQDRQGCNKVEIFWPNNLLKERIVIVDSPALDEKVFSVLKETREEIKRRQRNLLELFESIDACLNELSDKDYALLELGVKNLKNQMAHHKQRLERTEYAVLVAGERDSKKSTLLSLILGEQLLPDSFLGTSSIICELRYGTTHKLVAHFKEADPETGLHSKTIQREEMAENSQQIFLQQISSFFPNQDRGIWKLLPLKRLTGDTARVTKPKQRLNDRWYQSGYGKNEGIVIVDGPSIGKSPIEDEKLKVYLSEAFAVICVINSLAQQHVMEEPIKQSRKVCLDQQRETSSIFPLFLCNNWDQVSQEEADSIKNHVIGKLREYWPELDPNSQIIYFSSPNATNGEIDPVEFALLMDGIKSSALLNIKATLQRQWRWLNLVISRMAYHMKMIKDHISGDLRLDKRLCDIEKRLHSVEEEMQEHFRKLADDAARVLSKHLQSREVVEKFTSWTLDDIPKTESSWEVTEHFIQDAFTKRLQNTIAAWEDENHILSYTHSCLVRFSNQRFEEGKSLLPLRYLENAVISDDPASKSNICMSSNDFDAAKKVLIGVTSPIWVPVSVVLFPIFGVVRLKEELKEMIDSTKYEKDTSSFIVKASRKFLRHATKEQELCSIVKERLKDAQDYLTQVSSRLRELVAADKMLYHQLRDETRPIEKIQKFYGDLEAMSVRLKEKLALFFIKEVQNMVISRNDLEWDRGDQTSHLGIGVFATVYRGTFRIPRQREPTQVAVKLWNKELSESTAIGFLSKTETLRKLDFRFIVKFFGTALLREDGRWRVFHVMEMCEENLMNHILQNRKSIPALSVLCWAKDIAEAIEFIHSQGIVHRGLKLEKILLSQGNVIKVSGFRLPEEAKMITDMLTRTDANLTPEGIPNKEYDDKAEEEEAKMLTDTLKGTKAYLAPEVILNKEYDNKADIYSFGIMLWEMWYGERAFLEEGHALDKVVKGATPSHVQDDMRPSTGWQNLMQRCWDGKPNNRPDAAECHKVLTRLSQKVYPPSP
ncbi:Serine/threonine-protein kinase ULK2 [Stylophora pistillata]|uniref:Serine/threonine-protein kinase ULK2 n=1 Tax=Stylophora pistillata TaxID=50429 RepID=A0A2B4SX09_STYPI|nr:Serine/threonine-protein kinase ULK2 [Stylophora pistillata]